MAGWYHPPAPPPPPMGAYPPYNEGGYFNGHFETFNYFFGNGNPQNQYYYQQGSGYWQPPLEQHPRNQYGYGGFGQGPAWYPPAQPPNPNAITDENAQQELPANARVMVGNLAPWTDTESIRAAFSDIGRCYVNMKTSHRREPQSGSPDSYRVAFVQFERIDHAQRALQKDKAWFVGNRSIRVEMCRAGQAELNREFQELRTQCENTSSGPEAGNEAPVDNSMGDSEMQDIAVEIEEAPVQGLEDSGKEPEEGSIEDSQE